MSIRVNKNLTLKERKTYTFDSFRGVDFSTSPYKVAGNRATQAKNLIYKDGTVRKRNGWQSLCKLDGRINGLFSFQLNDKNFILCYAGTKFYLLEWNQKHDRLLHTDIGPVVHNDFVDRRIQLYVNNNKAYIVGCGDYLVFGKWSNGEYELRRVYDNEDTFIPTTTISIDEDSIEDEIIPTLYKVNLLSSKRKNRLLGVNADSGTWTVDTGVINDNSEIDIVLFTYREDAEGNKVQTVININNRFTGDLRSNLYATDDDLTIVGNVDYVNGKITLNINTKPLEEDTPNIIVTFAHSVEGQEDFITKATVSTVFGGGGNTNRLFISGNNEHKNLQMWSEQYDFTYFPDDNFDKTGSDSSAIVNYIRASDGTLLVFKEKNGSDSTLYYITAEDTEVLDQDNNVFFETKIYKKAGSISDTVYAKHATANLNGDNLILTKNGVRGLQLYENITVESYRTQERGRNINGKLLKHSNLKDASGFVFEDKYFLSVEGVVYVADSKFTFKSEEDINDSFNYEWWYWTNIDARVWCEINNELFFGTNNGLICKFHEGYADITSQDTKEGDLSIQYSSNIVTCNIELDEALNNSDNLVFTSDNIYSLFLSSNDIKGIDNQGYLQVDEETAIRLYEGIKLYATSVGTSGLLALTEYVIGEVDLDNLRFPLLQNGVQVVPSSTEFNLCKNLSGRTLLVANIVDDTFQLKEFEDSEVLDLFFHNNSPSSTLATIIFKRNVTAEWYTPIYDLGTNMFSKTLLNITVATEPLLKGSIVSGYQTRNLDYDFSTKGTRVFDFNDISFEDFSFESSFASSYTLKVKERNFNYIVIRYISDNQNSCAVNSITIRYKINQINKGVR